MSITGSTRMQATTIQLCVMLTVLEMVLRDLMAELHPDRRRRQPPACADGDRHCGPMMCPPSS